ncbi:hypothetical protein Ddye_012017 [Dipteronia dyeriana]|uniref:Uncharacterized protein n=1 Tax=Dipteronia dyeriana TaxID=168575 RepID=A0AAD9X3P0_9ROSI|nr:hypothetical protein Ddye_012017 [Dipteronia dyeriana]
MVLIHKENFIIPDKYILWRWRKDVTRCHTKVKIDYDSWSTKPEGHRFDKICNSFYELAYLATSSDDMCNIVIEGIANLKTKLISNGGENGSSRYIPTLNNDTSKENCNFLSPRAVRSKGHPLFKRKQSMVEKAFERLESDRFANIDVPPNSDHDGNILAIQESIMIELYSKKRNIKKQTKTTAQLTEHKGKQQEEKQPDPSKTNGTKQEEKNIGHPQTE